MRTGAGRAALLLAGLGAVVTCLRRSMLVVAVSGHSMEPTLSPGSRVLVRRCRPGAVRRGTVVVVAPPPSGEPAADPSLARLVKRVAALPGDAMPVGVGGPDSSRRVPRGRLVLLGDNASRSLDSRQLGCFRTDDVLGVVVRVLAR